MARREDRAIEGRAIEDLRMKRLPPHLGKLLDRMHEGPICVKDFKSPPVHRVYLFRVREHLRDIKSPLRIVNGYGGWYWLEDLPGRRAA